MAAMVMQARAVLRRQAAADPRSRRVTGACGVGFHQICSEKPCPSQAGEDFNTDLARSPIASVVYRQTEKPRGAQSRASHGERVNVRARVAARLRSGGLACADERSTR